MKTQIVTSAAIVALSTLFVIPADAQNQSAGGPPALAKQLAPARGGAKLSVTSRAMQWGAEIDERFTQDGDNRSPPVSWTKGPRGTASYAVLIEDASVAGAEPATHWVIYDIPSTATRVPENQPKEASLDSGALQGRNIRSEVGFVGPKPPAGQTHTYHVEVFALNTRLKLDPAEANRNDVVDAMKGHVLALGDMVVTYTGK